MKLEEVTPDNIRGVDQISDEELLNLRERANQLYRTATAWERHLRKSVVGVNQPIQKDELMEAYVALREEMKSRGLDSGRTPTALDRKFLRKSMRGFDVSDLPPVVVAEGVVVLDGLMVGNPKAASVASVRIDGDQFGNGYFTNALEKRVVTHFLDQVDLPAVVRRDNADLDGPILSLYDLVLVPRLSSDGEVGLDDLRKRLGPPEGDDLPEDDSLAAEAPETPSDDEPEPFLTVEDVTKYRNPAHVVQLVPLSPEFATYETKADHFGPGISVTYGLLEKTGKSKLVAIRFDAKEFLASAAEDWVKGFGYWTDEARMKPAEVLAKREPDDSPFLKNEDQRIVGGVVYYLNKVDAQGDFMDDFRELFDAMKSWMITGHVMKVMHNGHPVETPLVECFMAEGPCEKGGCKLEKGDWYISNYIPEEAEGLWQDIRDGKITGYSMGGAATEVEDVY